MLLFICTLESNAGSASDRCDVSDCTCRVYRGSYSPINIMGSNSNRSHNTYFEEDSSDIGSVQLSSLTQWAESIDESNRVSITIIGYTDGCGSSSYNSSLARARVESTSREIRKSVSNVRISTRIIGERVQGHSPESRRVDIIVHTSNDLVTRIERIPADVYLIDGSGSMWNSFRSWSDVINASLKPDSKIYVSMMSGCRNGQRIDAIRPQSGTEIWYSYWKVLEYMNPGETLLIISDFDSNFPLTSSERTIIERRAREKNITVYTVN